MKTFNVKGIYSTFKILIVFQRLGKYLQAVLQF